MGVETKLIDSNGKALASASSPIPVQSETAAIISMIERVARDPAIDIDRLERLLAMQKDIMAARAKSAYVEAFAAMQGELPEIQEAGAIDIGRAGVKPQRYALWEDINAAIKPFLTKHGFALSFLIANPAEGSIAVTGVLSHVGGHAEQTTLPLPFDTSGSKNAVQARGSSISHGKRYCAAALLNLTSRGEDDDGKAAAGNGPITQEQVDQIGRLLVMTDSNPKRFLDYIGAASIPEIRAKDFDRALAALERKAKQS